MITTWAKVQTVLNLETSQITLVDELIPLVQQDYLHIRNKPFDVGNVLTVTSGCTASGNLTITYNGTDFDVPVVAGDNALVVARKISFAFDRKLTTVSGASVTFLGYATLAFAAGGTGVTVTTTGIDTIYPIGAEMTAIKMIEHHLSSQRAGVASESLGDYSISYRQDATDYPQSIIGGIKRYVNFT